MHCNRREDTILFAVLLSVGSSFYTASAESGLPTAKLMRGRNLKRPVRGIVLDNPWIE